MRKRAPSLTRADSMRAWWDDPYNYAIQVVALQRRRKRALKIVVDNMNDGRNRAKNNARMRQYMRNYRAKAEAAENVTPDCDGAR